MGNSTSDQSSFTNVIGLNDIKFITPNEIGSINFQIGSKMIIGSDKYQPIMQKAYYIKDKNAVIERFNKYLADNNNKTKNEIINIMNNENNLNYVNNNSKQFQSYMYHTMNIWNRNFCTIEDLKRDLHKILNKHFENKKNTFIGGKSKKGKSKKGKSKKGKSKKGKSKKSKSLKKINK
jgi:hypothetical protein